MKLDESVNHLLSSGVIAMLARQKSGRNMPPSTPPNMTHALRSFSRARQPASRIISHSARWVTYCPRSNTQDVGSPIRGVHTSSSAQSHENPLVCIHLPP